MEDEQEVTLQFLMVQEPVLSIKVALSPKCNRGNVIQCGIHCSGGQWIQKGLTCAHEGYFIRVIRLKNKGKKLYKSSFFSDFFHGKSHMQSGRILLQG